MNSKWTTMWKKLLIWASGYLSFIAFALVGGYVILKEEDEQLKLVTKQVFVLTLIFTAVSMVLSIYNSVGSLFDGWYSSVAYDIYDILTTVRSIAQIVVYALGAILTLTKKQQIQQEPQDAPQE